MGIISVIQLQKALSQWRKNDELNAWLSKYIQILYFLSIISGSSFVAVQICTSGAFSHRLTNMPLNKHKVLAFKAKLLYGTVILENIPQLCIQCLYLWMSQKMNDYIVWISIAFSLLSLILCCLSMIEQKKLSDSTGYDEISFDVTGSMVTAEDESGDRHKHRNKFKKIQASFAGEFGLSADLLEIMKPTPVKNGFKVKIFVFVGNERSIDQRFAQKMNLAEIMMDCWNLYSLPTISNTFHCRHSSKKRQNNEIEVKIACNNADCEGVNIANGSSNKPPPPPPRVNLVNAGGASILSTDSDEDELQQIYDETVSLQPNV